MENLQNNSWKFTHEIFAEIQRELHEEGKQYPECIWNDKTGFIKFRKNELAGIFSKSDPWKNDKLCHFLFTVQF